MYRVIYMFSKVKSMYEIRPESKFCLAIETEIKYIFLKKIYWNIK